ncbi:MAG: PDZ domain-containing protein [Bacteroidota bacterium]
MAFQSTYLISSTNIECEKRKDESICGQHQDYHKPIDDSHTLNFSGIQSVSDIVVDLIEALDGQGKLTFTKTKDESQSRRSSFKVTLGVMPDYVGADEKGMKIDAVIDGKPAQKAGLEGGDIIIKIGETEIEDIYGYMKALGKFEKGQETEVVVKRGDETRTFTVVF